MVTVLPLDDICLPVSVITVQCLVCIDCVCGVCVLIITHTHTVGMSGQSLMSMTAIAVLSSVMPFGV